MRATSSSSRSVICARASLRLTRNRSARSSIASSARAGSRARQRGDGVHAVEQEVRADARLQRADARARLELDAAPPFAASRRSSAARARRRSRRCRALRQQEGPVPRREQPDGTPSPALPPAADQYTPSETSATVPTISASAHGRATRASERRASHGRAPAQHARRTAGRSTAGRREVRARSIQKPPRVGVRARAPAPRRAAPRPARRRAPPGARRSPAGRRSAPSAARRRAARAHRARRVAVRRALGARTARP